MSKVLDVQAEEAVRDLVDDGEGGGGDGEEDGAGTSTGISDVLLKRQIKGLRVTVANLTADKDKLAKDLEEKTKSLNHYKGKKEAASGGAKAEVDKVKADFENYKRKSEDQMSKAKSYLSTLKKSLADAELNLDKLRSERAAVMAANRDAHATAEEALARQAEIDDLRENAALAEPLRKFAKEVCASLGVKYVEPKVGGGEDGHEGGDGGESGGGGGGGLLPNIGARASGGSKSGNPLKKVGGAGGGGAGAADAEGIGAALATIQTAGRRVFVS